MNLVGRATEMAEGRRWIRRGGLMLPGAPGVGKTALAHALLDEVKYECTVQWLFGLGTGPAIPFGAFAPLVPEIGGLDPKPSSFDLMQEIRRQVIQSAGGKPLILAVDDGHRLHESSARLIMQLVASGAASAVVTVRSAARLPEGLRALWKDGLVGRIDVEPLGRDDTVELAASLLGGKVDGNLAEILWETSGGNPLYLRELVWAAKSAGRVVKDWGIWTLDGDLEIGPRVCELVQERFAKLSRSELATMEVVGFGEPMPMTVLRRIVPSSHIASLQRQGLISVVETHNQEQVRTAHPVYGEVLRSNMTAPRLRDLRVQLAKAFEGAGRLGTDLLRVVTWRLDAGHGEDPDILLAASHRAAATNDWKLAARLAKAVQDTAKEPAAALRLAEALQHLGRYDEALGALGDWRGEDDDEIAQVAILRSHILYWGLGRLDEADESLARAEQEVEDRSSRACVQAARASMRTFTGRPGDAVEMLSPVMAQKGLSARATVAGRTALSLALAWSGHPDSAVDVIDPCAAPELRRSEGDPGPVRWTVLARLAAYRMAGRVDEMERLATAEYEKAVRLHNREAQGGTAGALGWACLARGDLSRAIEYFRESAAVLYGADWTQVRRQSLTGLIEALALKGDADAAEAVLAETGGMQTSGRRLAGSWIGPRLTISGAWVDAARGELTRAVEGFLSAAEAARNNGQIAFEIVALHCAARLGETSVAERLAELATWVEGPLVQLASAFAMALASGNGEELDRVADGWSELTMWLLAAECAAQASRAHTIAGSPRRAAASAARAQAILEQCGGTPVPAVATLLAMPNLTRREQEVARLAENGLSSHEIAERLFLSVRTVDSHLARVYSKLGIHGRHQLGPALTARSQGRSEVVAV